MESAEVLVDEGAERKTGLLLQCWQLKPRGLPAVWPAVHMKDSLLVVLNSGLDDGGRKAAIAFGVALSALSNGNDVHVFLSLECAALGTPTGAAGLLPRGFSEPLSAYVDEFLGLGGHLEVCSSCLEEYCRDSPKDESGQPALRPGTAIRGLGVVAERAHTMPVLTF